MISKSKQAGYIILKFFLCKYDNSRHLLGFIQFKTLTDIENVMFDHLFTFLCKLFFCVWYKIIAATYIPAKGDVLKYKGLTVYITLCIIEFHVCKTSLM